LLRFCLIQAIFTETSSFCMKNTFLIVGGAIAAAIFFLRKAAVASSAKLLFRGVRVNLGARRIELNFAVQNASGGAATLRAITGEVFVNDKLIADFSNFSEQRIGPRSESPLKLNAQLSAGLFSLLTQKGWLKGSVTYTIKGVANFDGITQPFSFISKLK
jgi:hypothetical protein